MTSQTPQGPKLPKTPPASAVGICYLTSILQSAHAGTEGHLLRLVRSLDRTRFAPHLAVLQDSPFIDAWNDPSVPLRSLSYQSLYRPASLAKILQFVRWVKQTGIQILELHSPEAQFVGCLVARLAGVPVVVGCRRNLGYNSDWKSKLQHRLTNPLITRFVANSQVVIQQMSQKEQIEIGRFDLIYNGVDLPRFDAEKLLGVNDAFANFARDSVLVSVAANLRPVKNLSMFLRAAARVARTSDRAKFALLGAGSEQAHLMQLARDLGIQDRVLFAGPQVPVAPYLYHSHVGCLSSDSEGFSNAIVECMAASLPVVATSVGGAAEAIVEGETGFLVPAGDDEQFASRLSQLVEQPDLGAKMGEQGRARVEREFHQDRQVGQFMALYERLVAANRS